MVAEVLDDFGLVDASVMHHTCNPKDVKEFKGLAFDPGQKFAIVPECAGISMVDDVPGVTMNALDRANAS